MHVVQAAYAFRATYQNGGHGLNFSNLHDYNNHWIYATCVCAVETVLAVVMAWYLEQVLSSGTGVRRHPLFFLQKRKSAGGSGEAAPKSHRRLFGFMHRQGRRRDAAASNKVIKVGICLFFTPVPHMAWAVCSQYSTSSRKQLHHQPAAIHSLHVVVSTGQQCCKLQPNS